MKKWKGIKDSYNRSERAKTKSGQGTSKVYRQYQYARQLEVLQHTGKKGQTTSSLDDEVDVNIDNNDGGNAEDIDDLSSLVDQTKNRDQPVSHLSDSNQTPEDITPGESTGSRKRHQESTKKSFDELPAGKRGKVIEQNLLQCMQTPAPLVEAPKKNYEDVAFFQSLLLSIRTLNKNKLRLILNHTKLEFNYLI